MKDLFTMTDTGPWVTEGCDVQYKTRLDERFDRLTHVTVRGDIVTMVPFAFLGYRHVGNALKIGPVSLPSPKNHCPEKYLAYLV